MSEPLPATPKTRLAISGAGVGGLALALVLKRAGYDPVVYESRSEAQLRTEGVFLTLAPNGINALRAIGLAEAVIAAGIVTEGLVMNNERGKTIARVDYGRHGTRFGAPSVTLRRGALAQVLLEAAHRHGVAMRFSQPVESVTETGLGVTIRAGGAPSDHDALVACDGLRSPVRRAIFPDLPTPLYTGLVGTGGFAHAPDVAATAGRMMMTFGKRAFFGYLAAPGHPVYWFNSYPAPESATGTVGDAHAHLRKIAALHRDDPLANAHILAAMPGLDQHYPIYDMPELARWHTARVVLMGDAAHAVAPHSGQGASMAIEDAVVLGACLEHSTGPSDAFARFEALRRARTDAAIKVGRLAGSQKHAQSWLQLRFRDLILPIVMPMGVAAQEKLYRFRADRAPLTLPSQ